MKMTYRSPGGRIEVTVDVADERELVAQLGRLQALCEEPDCGLCGSRLLRFDCRTAQGFMFYELRCRGCAGRLSLGQTKEGNHLFPRRRDENGEELPARGWHLPPTA